MMKMAKSLTAAIALMLPAAPILASSTLDEGRAYGDSAAPQQQSVRVEKEAKDCDPLKAVLFYVPNRVSDLLDTLHLSASFGPPGAKNIRITRNLWFGITELNVHRFGLIGHRTSFYEKEVLHDECGFNLFNVWKCGCTPRRPLEVGVDVHCGIGARAAIDFATFGDFLAGFVFCDPHDDDFGPSLICKKEKTKHHAQTHAKTDRSMSDSAQYQSAK